MIRSLNRILFFTAFALSLAYVWYPHYFLTNDGPTHVYNANILRDWLTDRPGAAFYHYYYQLVAQPNPNWLSHLLLAGFMLFVKGIVAEKLLLTLYIFLFVSGYTLLIRKLSGNIRAWPLFIFLFLFNHATAFGFYNFSLGVALLPWVVWMYLLLLGRLTAWRLVGFAVLWASLFFAHLLLFVIGVATCLSLALSWSWAQKESSGKTFATLCMRNMGLVVLFVLPFTPIAGGFSDRQGGLQLQIGHHFYRLVELLQLKFLINLSPAEVVPQLIAGCTLVGMCLLSVVSAVRSRKVMPYDGLFIVVGLVFFVYVCFPDVVFGKQVMLSFRMQIVLGLLLVCLIASRQHRQLTTGIFHLAGALCFLVLVVVRVQAMARVSEGEEELLSCATLIKPTSTLLPLNFAPGLDIPERGYPFIHATDYLGLNAPLIILDNYEAATGFFPLRWTHNCDPYFSLIVGHGIETTPPQADIPAWEAATGRHLDYVLTWCYDPVFLADPGYKKLDSTINRMYKLVYRSPQGRALLYERTADAR